MKGPTAPMKRFVGKENIKQTEIKSFSDASTSHPLTNTIENNKLSQYENDVKARFDNIVPLLKKVSTLQHEENFIEKAQELSRSKLGYELPVDILEKAWVGKVDIRALFAGCVFRSHQLISDEFFNSDPLDGSADSHAANLFNPFCINVDFIF